MKLSKTELKRIQNALKHQSEVSIKFGGNIVVIGTYINNYTPIEYYCILHDEFFCCVPINILKENRKGCRACSGKTQWTTELIIKRIQFINQDQDGNNTLIIDDFDYKRVDQYIWLTCLIDGHKWKAQITDLIHSKHGCSECIIRNKRISYDELHERNNKINTDEFGVLRVIIRCTREWYERNYKGTQTKIPVGCSNPDHPDWWVQVGSLLNAESGCLECSGHTKLTIENFFKKIHKKFLNENGLPLHKFNFRTFNGVSSYIKIFDPEHGWFEKKVEYYLLGYGHPNAPKTKSKGELAVQEFLLENNIKFMREYKVPELPRLRVDFFLIEQCIMIEVDGEQHDTYIPWIHKNDYSKFETQQRNDRKKDQWCQDNGIRMIRITNIKDIQTQLAFLI